MNVRVLLFAGIKISPSLSKLVSMCSFREIMIVPNLTIKSLTFGNIIFLLSSTFQNEFMIVKFLVKPLANRVKELRLSRDDFDMLNLIGKGAFGEVSLWLCCWFCENIIRKIPSKDQIVCTRITPNKWLLTVPL